MVTASEVARYIINAFHESEDAITNMKVQKLLYYVQGWHLGLYNKPVFAGDFQAWVHGPVQCEVYNEYKHYKWESISAAVEKPQLDIELVNHIEEVLESYGGETAYELELLTHREWPWLKARDDLPSDERSNNIISQETMQEYFLERAQENEKNHNYTLNKETIKALEESKRNFSERKRYKSVKALFDDIYAELEAEGVKVGRYV